MAVLFPYRNSGDKAGGGRRRALRLWVRSALRGSGSRWGPPERGTVRCRVAGGRTRLHALDFIREWARWEWEQFRDRPRRFGRGWGSSALAAGLIAVMLLATGFVFAEAPVGDRTPAAAEAGGESGSVGGEGSEASGDSGSSSASSECPPAMKMLCGDIHDGCARFHPRYAVNPIVGTLAILKSQIFIRADLSTDSSCSLFRWVVVHETGHIFGLNDFTITEVLFGSNPTSVMLYPTEDPPRYICDPTLEDITAVVALYQNR